MRAHTDTVTTVYNEDGSWTTTSEVTNYPASKKEKALAGTLLGAMVLAPLAPLLTVVALEKWDDTKEKRRLKKAAKNEK